jgi:hypothetical protein
MPRQRRGAVRASLLTILPGVAVVLVIALHVGLVGVVAADSR